MASDEIHWPNFRPPTFFFPPPQSTKKSSYDLNGKIMLAAIISLSVVVLLVLLLHIYARWLLRRQAQRRAAMRRLGLMVAHGPSSTELVTPKTGLDPSVIALLPMFAFKQPDNSRDSSSPTEAVTSTAVLECAVCLSVLEDGEMVRVLPKCKHMFHVECIDMWLGSHATCPLCRAEAQPEQPGPDEPTSEPVSLAAPPVERVDSSVSGVDDGSGRGPGKSVGSGSRLSSFRRMLSRETSSRRIQPDENVGEDIERQ